jgi:hypothetical protein
MKKSSEEKMRELCGGIVGEAMEKLQALTGDSSYSGYIAFVVIGSTIAEHEGMETVEKYVKEIRKERGK